MKRSRLIPTAITLCSLLLISVQTQSRGQESEGLKWGQNSISGPGTVKITPLGSHAGEFCRNDRALLFDDPTGVRILWDPGRTVDETDPKLGVVHVVMLSSAQGDHLGDAKPNPSPPGTCAAPGTVPAAPHPNAAAIAAGKNAAIFTWGEMADFIGRNVQNIRGAATASCAAAGPNNELIVPLSSPCAGSLRPGGSRTVRLNGASAGVRIANFQAFHSNGIPSGFVNSPGISPGTTGYGGSQPPATKS